MTVLVQDVISAPYAPNGVTTVFPFSFQVGATDEVAAQIDGVTLDPALYSVTLNADGTGSATFFAAPTGTVLYLLSSPTFSQPSTLENQGPYFQHTIETMVDRLARGSLWLRSRLARLVPSDLLTASLPGRFLTWDASSNPIFSSGTGSDPALRSDLATGTGALIGGPRSKTAKDYFTSLFIAEYTLASFTTAAQATSWHVGDACFVPVYGGSRWTVRASVQLQNGDENGTAPGNVGSSIVNFSDELHIQVPLIGGGTGVLECDLGSIENYVATQVTELYAVQFMKLERKEVLGSAATINCYGDSTTYGQVDVALGTPVATNYGDGSYHVWQQVGSPWPAYLLAFLDAVLGTGKVSVNNRGFSGDRVGSAYRRHRSPPTPGTISFIAYGINDDFYGSNNGVNTERLFDETNYPLYLFRKFTPALRKFVYREVLRGSLPILCAPHFLAAASGQDGTVYMAGKVLAMFRGAIKAVADEIGAGFIDWSEIVSTRDLATMTSDGVHLSDAGHNMLAAQTVGPLVGKGWRYATRIYGRTLLAAGPWLENVNGPFASGVDMLAGVANAGTLGQPIVNATQGLDMIIGTRKRFFSFYSEVDEVAVMPVGTLQNTAVLGASLDFGAGPATRGQGEARLNTVRGAASGTFVNYAATATYTNATGLDKAINHPGSSPIAPIIVRNRGWHTINFDAATASFILSGILFDPLARDMGAVVSDPAAITYAAPATTYVAPAGGATIDAQARASLAQLATDVAAMKTAQSASAADFLSVRTALATLLSRLRDRSAIKS